jgi:hypothetical protein
MKKMTRFLTMGLLGVLVLLVGGFVTAQAAVVTMVLDEYGPGYFYTDTNSQHISMNGQLRDDPTWPGHRTLIYTVAGYTSFPNGWTYWDAQVYEAGTTTGQISDVVRPYHPGDQAAGTWIIFYSVAGGGAPADTGFPNNLNVQVTTTENLDGTFSFTSPYSANEVKGSSGPVPLPAAIWLLGPGLVSLAALRRRFKK